MLPASEEAADAQKDAASSRFFLVMVTMEEVRDPALSGRISVLTTELTYNQTTAFWRD